MSNYYVRARVYGTIDYVKMVALDTVEQVSGPYYPRGKMVRKYYYQKVDDDGKPFGKKYAANEVHIAREQGAV